MSSKKGTNPKDAAAMAQGRVPLGLFPSTAIVAGAMAMHEGDLKYGGFNWRKAGIRVSVYVDALKRHLEAWWNGEDIDSDSGLNHLWKALACLAIMIDAQVVGNMVDDRPPSAPVGEMLKDLKETVAQMERDIGRQAERFTQVAGGPPGGEVPFSARMEETLAEGLRRWYEAAPPKDEE